MSGGRDEETGPEAAAAPAVRWADLVDEEPEPEVAAAPVVESGVERSRRQPWQRSGAQARLTRDERAAHRARFCRVRFRGVKGDFRKGLNQSKLNLMQSAAQQCRPVGGGASECPFRYNSPPSWTATRSTTTWLCVRGSEPRLGHLGPSRHYASFHHQGG
jgi:hypothetical protein